MPPVNAVDFEGGSPAARKTHPHHAPRETRFVLVGESGIESLNDPQPEETADM
jgi:hypothetical protein